MEGEVAQLFDVGAVDEHVDFGEQGVSGFVVACAEFFERVAGVQEVRYDDGFLCSNRCP